MREATTPDGVLEGAPTELAAPPRRASWLRTFAWSFLALFAIFAAWAIGNPLTAAPDEPAHATKAAAVVHGQLVGKQFDPEHPGWGHVEVPAVVAFTTQMPNCFAFKAQVTASCIPPLPADPTVTTEAVSTASTYNPVYYAMVGLPSLDPTGARTLYLMRLVSAALCALVLAWGFSQSLTARRGSWVTAATMLALTPMVVYLSGAINPASLEIACAAALWVSLPVIIRDDDVTRLRPRIIGVAIIASVFVNLRGLSPLFLAFIILGSVLSSPWSRTWRILKQRSTWPWLGLVGLSSIAALVWTRTAGTLDSDGLVHYPMFDFWTAVQWSLGDTSVYVSNMMGQFGWVDTNLPTWLLLMIAATIGALVVLALVAGSTRERLVMLALAVITIAVPVIIHASQAKYLGIVWQGRYFLPAAVGLPILAGFACARALGDDTRRLAWRASIVLGGSWVVYQAAAFAINLHRYQKGYDTGWRGVPTNQWNPPLSMSALLAILLAGLIGITLLSIRTARPRLTPGLDAATDAARSDVAGSLREE